MWCFSNDVLAAALQDWQRELSERGATAETCRSMASQVRMFLESESAKRNKLRVTSARGEPVEG